MLRYHKSHFLIRNILYACIYISMYIDFYSEELEIPLENLGPEN